MSANGISTLTTKQARQEAKLAIAQTKRQATGTNGYRTNNVADVTELPTKYVGNAVVDNPNTGGLKQARPWAP